MKKLLVFLVIIFLLPLALAVDFTPSGNINGRNIYDIFNFKNIYNVTNITISGNLSVNGSVVCTATNGLCSAGGGNSSWNQTLAEELFCSVNDNTTLWSNASAQNTLILTLYTNASGQQTDLQNLWANASGQQTDLQNLWANASGQQTDLQNLWANASGQQTDLQNLWSNASAQAATIGGQANSITALQNSNGTMFTNASNQQAALEALKNSNSTLFTNASNQQSALEALKASNSTLFTNASDQQAALEALKNSNSTLFTNASNQQTALEALKASNSTLFTNASDQASAIGGLSLSITALQNSNGTLFTNASNQQASLEALKNSNTTLFSNASGQQTDLQNLWSNASNQQSSLESLKNSNITLFSNASGQQTDLQNLWANASAQAAQLGSGSGGYSTIADETTALTARTKLNFTGAGVTCVDDAGSSSTVCAISGSGGTDFIAIDANMGNYSKNAGTIVANITQVNNSVIALQNSNTTLFSNASGQQTDLQNLWANASNQQTALEALKASNSSLYTNASDQAAAIGGQSLSITALQNSNGTLFTNASNQQAALEAIKASNTTLFSNASSQQNQIEGLLGSNTTLFTNASNQQAALEALKASNTTLFSNASGQQTDLQNLWANASAQAAQLGTGGGGYTTIAEETTALTARTKLNFTGAGVTCTDDSGSSSTVCNIPSGGSSADNKSDQWLNTTQNVTFNNIKINETKFANYGPFFIGNVNGSFETSVLNTNTSSGASANSCFYNTYEKENDYFCMGVNGINYSNSQYNSQLPGDAYIESKNKDIHLLVQNSSAGIEFYVGGANNSHLQTRINSSGLNADNATFNKVYAQNYTLTPGGGFIGSGGTVNGTSINVSSIIINGGTSMNSTLTLTSVINGSISVPTPTGDVISVYSAKQGGRNMLRVVGSSGMDYNLQPSMYQQAVVIVLPGFTTAVSQIGTTTAVVTSGTVSTPVANSKYGRRAVLNSLAANQSNASLATGDTTWLRGQNSTSEAGASGWYLFERLNFENDTTQYTGVLGNSSIIFVGMTSGTMSLMSWNTSANGWPAGSWAGFYYSNMTLQTSHNNWSFITSNGTAGVGISVYNTSLPFSGLSAVDFYQFCKPGCTQIGYRVSNQITRQSYEGVTVDDYRKLPVNTTLLRAGFSGNDVLTQKSIGISMSKIYIESDR